MTAGAFRAGDYGVIFDGQSLPVHPLADQTLNFPARLMTGRLAPDGVVAVGGLSWQQLDNDVSARIGPFVKMAPKIVYIQVGGTTQVNLGQAAADIYASEGAIIAQVAALVPGGSDFYVIGTTTTPSTAFDPTSDAILITLNALKLADASNFYDVVVDLAGDPRLDDPTDTTAYSDGTHLTTTNVTGGHAIFAELLAVALDSLV